MTGAVLAASVPSRSRMLGLDLKHRTADLRYTDKDSGIVNDPNQWGLERGEPRYIVDLIKRVVTASVRTIEIVSGLPSLEETIAGLVVEPVPVGPGAYA